MKKMILLLVVLCAVSGCTQKQGLLKDTHYTLEYGDTLDATQLFNKEVSSYTIESCKTSVGVHACVVSYRYNDTDYTDEIEITIQDTTVPKITVYKDPILISQNGNFLAEDYFKVMDSSAFEVDVDTTTLDVSQLGIYSVTVVAKDVYDNSSNVTLNVEVVEKMSVKTPYNTTTPTYVNGHIIVNKKHPLPKNYVPDANPKAVEQIKALIKAMQDLGYNVGNRYSQYRSYEGQAFFYNRYVANSSKEEAETYSARPGYSEHQTGLAFDLHHRNDIDLVVGEKEATWIEENAHVYGFIVRYPQNKESITGYIYEPWHLRYMGDDATIIYESGLTLEEYFEFPGGNYINKFDIKE